MLNLQSETPERWLQQVEAHLDQVLIDHAHCERKAASTALGLFSAYIENQELCREMTLIVNEELEHFHQVIAILNRRGIRFQRQKPSAYGRRLYELIRKHEPQRGVDRLLIASLIEARSCERFDLLRKHMRDRELADFFDSLFECEARHHATYVRMAKTLAPAAVVQARLKELAVQESRIIALGDERVRMHS
jgi:tRNA-(ms[2]io[6]A)-hydroxylase